MYASGSINATNRLPVLVWFHGGGCVSYTMPDVTPRLAILTCPRYVAGNVQNEKGDDLINEAGGGVIVVTLDHRLGGFGTLLLKNDSHTLT